MGKCLVISNNLITFATEIKTTTDMKAIYNKIKSIDSEDRDLIILVSLVALQMFVDLYAILSHYSV